MSEGTPRRSIRVEDELWEAALLKAASEGENLSDVLRKALQDYIGIVQHRSTPVP